MCTNIMYIWILPCSVSDLFHFNFIGQRSTKYGHGYRKSNATAAFGETLATIHTVCSVPRSIQVQSDQ